MIGDDMPRAGEVWKWHWLWVTIVKAGPKRVTYQTDDGVSSAPTDRFLRRFHRTGVTANPPPAADVQPEQVETEGVSQ